MSSDAPAPARRARVRFSLRTFLVALTIACLWFGYHVHGANRQRHAVDAIRDHGGWVRYSYEFTDGAYDPKADSWAPLAARRALGVDFFHPVVEVNFVYSEDSGKRADNRNLRAAPLEHLIALPELTRLYLHESQANDDNLRHVARLRRLERFFVWDATDVTDAGVVYLSGLRNLKYIHLSESQITDESLRVFAGLPNLEGLSLQFNRFTDEGVARLASLRKLTKLAVCGTRDHPNPITDASLEFLLELPSFNRLVVQETEVTAEFAARLNERHPICQVVR